MNFLSSRQSGPRQSAYPITKRIGGLYTPTTANTSRSRAFSPATGWLMPRLYGGDNGIEVFSQEAGATNEATIDVFNVQNLSRVLRLHRSAIENADGFAPLAKALYEPRADGTVNGGDIFKAWRATRAD